MPDPLTRKVLLIGWDAADWRMIDPLLAAGQMPALAGLMKRGAWGQLATIRPMLSPMLWTSIATGKRADKHGIHGFLEPRPDASGVRPVRSTSRSCQALWNIAAQRGLRSCVVNWFASYPAEAVPGVVVSEEYAAAVQPGVDCPELSDRAVHPPELSAPLSRLLVDPARLDEQALLPFVPRAAEIDQTRDDRLLHLATLLARAASTQAAARFSLENSDWDLGCLFFGAIDEFGHHFMPFHPPRLEGVDPRDAELYGQVMTGCYRFQDMMLQTLLEVAGPETTVVLVSDHGFYHDEQRPGARGDDNPEAWHRPYGIAALAGPGIRPGQRLYGANLLDVTPTILHLLGLPVGADMDGRPWVEITTQPRAVERILSWEDLGSAAASAPQKPATESETEAPEDPVTAALTMQHLADLGYLEPGDPDQRARVDGVIREQKINLARALSDSRRSGKAIALWQELVDEEPDRLAFRVELARALLQAGQPESCLKALGEVGASFTGRLLRVEALLKLRETNLARAELRQLSREAPDHPGVLVRLGRLLLDQDQQDEADTLLHQAWRMDPQQPAAVEALSHLALRRGDYDTAVRHALDAIDLAHHFPRAHFRLGCALAGQGDVEHAVQALQTCLQQAPNFVAAHRELARLLPPGPDADRHALLAQAHRTSPTAYPAPHAPHAPPATPAPASPQPAGVSDPPQNSAED